MRKGERLTEPEVREIRRWRKRFRRDSYRVMAMAFNVSHMTIARIVRGETYRGVK